MTGGRTQAGPVGVFDSGVGGLAAVRALHTLLPGENIIYFGDSGRMPYGGRPRVEIERMALEDARFLLDMGAKALLVACGTITSNAMPYLLENLDVPVLGVVSPAAERASRLTRNGRVGVFSTEASERSGAYVCALRDISPGLEAVPASSARLAALIESGVTDGAEVRGEIALCARKLASGGADTLILGCTHYRAVESLIAEALPGVTIVDCGECGASAMAAHLRENSMLADRTNGDVSIFSSGMADIFEKAAGIFLGEAFSHEVFHADL